MFRIRLPDSNLNLLNLLKFMLNSATLAKAAFVFLGVRLGIPLLGHSNCLFLGTNPCVELHQRGPPKWQPIFLGWRIIRQKSPAIFFLGQESNHLFFWKIECLVLLPEDACNKLLMIFSLKLFFSPPNFGEKSKKTGFRDS